MGDELKIKQLQEEKNKLEAIEHPTLAVKILLHHANEAIKQEMNKNGKPEHK